MSANTGAILHTDNAEAADHTWIHDCFYEDTTVNNTRKVLFETNDGTNNCISWHLRVDTSVPRARFILKIGSSGSPDVLNVDCSPAINPLGRRITSVLSFSENTSSGTYTVRVYLDGVLWGTGTATGVSATSTTRPTEFCYTNRFATASSAYTVCRGVHSATLLNVALSDAQADTLVALNSWTAPFDLHQANAFYNVGLFGVSSSGLAGQYATSANIMTFDINAASSPALLYINRAGATVDANVECVDPFQYSNIPPSLPVTTVDGSAPASFSVGSPTIPANATTLRLYTLYKGWRDSSFSATMRIALLANSRCSIPNTCPYILPGDNATTGRVMSGNLVDYDFFWEFARTAAGRHNFQPPLNTTNGGAWGFDCTNHAPLTTGTSCVDLSATTAARFGTGTRVAGAGSPTYQGPGDPIRVPTSASYRLCAGPEIGLAPSDAITVDVYILNYPNSSEATVIKEAAQHVQNGAALSLGYSNETVPALGTSMTAATFTGYNATTNVFSGLNTVADAQVGDMLEVCDSSGNTISDVELACITAITADTITVDGKFKTGATIASTPANYTLKWCAPGIVKISGTHAASQTNANWRGLKITSGATRGGVILLGFGVSNTSRPGPEIMPIGWSGRGWTDQYTQMSHIVSARDGKTMSQRLFETLDPDLVMFTVADQGNTSTKSLLPGVIRTYMGYIRQGAPNAEIVMAGEGPHSQSEDVPNITEAASNYNTHQAAMREVSVSDGLTYLSLLTDRSIGSPVAQYARSMLMDGSAHPYRNTWGGWMRQVGKVTDTSLETTYPRSIARQVR
jgi:hypothetical protein